MLVAFQFSFCLSQFNNFFEYFARGRFASGLSSAEANSVLSYLNGLFLAGGFVSSLTSSQILGLFSPRALFLVSMALVTLCYLAQTWGPLGLMYAARFLAGYFIILNVILGPLMVSHCCPPAFVGKLGSLFGFFNAFGILMSSLVKSKVTEEYWFLFFNIPTFIEALRLLAFLLCFGFESPFFVFLSLSKRLRKAKEKEKQGRGQSPEPPQTGAPLDSQSDFADAQLKEAFFADARLNSLLQTTYFPKDVEARKAYLFKVIEQYFRERQSLRGFFKTACSRSFRAQFWIGCLLHFARQGTGISVIVIYSKKLFQILDFGDPELLVTFAGSLTRRFLRGGQLCLHFLHRPLWKEVPLVCGAADPGSELPPAALRADNGIEGAGGGGHLPLSDGLHQLLRRHDFPLPGGNHAHQPGSGGELGGLGHFHCLWALHDQLLRTPRHFLDLFDFRRSCALQFPFVLRLRRGNQKQNQIGNYRRVQGKKVFGLSGFFRGSKSSKIL